LQKGEKQQMHAARILMIALVICAMAWISYLFNYSYHPPTEEQDELFLFNNSSIIHNETEIANFQNESVQVPNFIPESCTHFSALYAQIDEDFAPLVNATFTWNVDKCKDQCLGLKIVANTVEQVFSRNPWQSRHENFLKLINQVLQVHSIPDIDLMIIHTGDIPTNQTYPFFCINRAADPICILCPDFTFVNRKEAKLEDSWHETLEHLKNASIQYKFETRNDTAIWRGNNLRAEYEGGHRAILVELSEEHPNELDAKFVNFKGQGDGLKHYMPITNFCRYKYLIHTNGISYSSRLKYLMACKSLVFFPKSEYREYWYHLLEDGHNIVSVTANFSDLIPKLQQAKRNDSHAANENAGKLVEQYLNMDAVLCYWAVILRRYANLLKNMNI